MARRDPDHERGAAAVEFALVAMILLTMVVMIMQASLWMWGYQVASHAAREGARVAAVDPCPPTSAASSKAVARVGGAGTGVSATVDPITAPVTVGGEVTVRVNVTARVIAPGLLPAFPEIHKSATTRIEYIPTGTC